MIELKNLINSITLIDDNAQSDLLNAFKTKTFRKGDFVLKPNKASEHFYFILSGLVKSSFNNGEKEFIMTFFKENMIFTEFSSYLTQKPSKYMLVALENTEILQIHRDKILELCKKHHCIEALFSKLFSYGTLGMMKRISEMLEESAAERYNIFITENSGLTQRISLGDTANYLGITQVSLSRIRSGK
ncbi:MAG TPA: Crp/Fnr family transcriptional regulator [Cyclobacteriaceae bacterium]